MMLLLKKTNLAIFIDINGRNLYQITQFSDLVAFDGISMIMCCRSDEKVA